MLSDSCVVMDDFFSELFFTKNTSKVCDLNTAKQSRCKGMLFLGKVQQQNSCIGSHFYVTIGLQGPGRAIGCLFEQNRGVFVLNSPAPPW